jgi:hypothetical protein
MIDARIQNVGFLENYNLIDRLGKSSLNDSV